MLTNLRSPFSLRAPPAARTPPQTPHTKTKSKPTAPATCTERQAQPKWSLLHGRRSVCPAGRRSRLTRRAHGIRSSMCAPPPHTTRGSFDASRRAANGTSFSSSIRHAQPKWSLLHGRRSVCPAVRRHHDTTTAPSLFSRVRPPAASLPRQLEGSLFPRLGMPSVSRGRADTFD